MRRSIILLMFALLLAACGGPAFDPASAIPPNATAVEQTGNAELDGVINSWRESVPEAMTERAIKADSIQQNVYTTSGTLADIQTYYDTTFSSENGWMRSTRMPGLDAEQGVLLLGYETAGNSIVVGALDPAKFNGDSTVVYTATGNK